MYKKTTKNNTVSAHNYVFTIPLPRLPAFPKIQCLYKDIGTFALVAQRAKDSSPKKDH
jgi:hypothetical protein